MKIQNQQASLIQLLSVPGLLIAFYLLLFHNGSLLTTCAAGGWEDCGLVSGPDAPYSSIGPVPVALIGLIGFGVIFLLTWVADWVSVIESFLPELLIGVIGIALVFTIGLTALEILVIHAVCRFCLVSATIIILMFILAVSYLREANHTEDDAGELHEARIG